MKLVKNFQLNLIIDIGNTRVKTAVFKQDTMIKLFIFDKKKIISEIKKILSNYTIQRGIVSSVTVISEKKLQKLQSFLPILLVNSNTNVPFNNLYKTPNTLGVDRVALVTAAIKKYPNKNVLIIDAGTCITYDFISSKKNYLGGAISPGIIMRYKSLHTFTAKLPLLKVSIPKKIIGKTTRESINSGVINGVCYEIEGVIWQYKKIYQDLTIVLTGGDTNFLAKQLKSSIFANQNFLLYGLNEILIYNKK